MIYVYLENYLKRVLNNELISNECYPMIAFGNNPLKGFTYLETWDDCYNHVTNALPNTRIKKIEI